MRAELYRALIFIPFHQKYKPNQIQFLEKVEA